MTKKKNETANRLFSIGLVQDCVNPVLEYNRSLRAFVLESRRQKEKN